MNMGPYREQPSLSEPSEPSQWARNTFKVICALFVCGLWVLPSQTQRTPCVDQGRIVPIMGEHLECANARQDLKITQQNTNPASWVMTCVCRR